jgi:hypothetical protein
MVITPDWQHFWTPLSHRLQRGARAILVIVFVTLVWFVLRFEVAGSMDNPLIEFLLLIVGLLLTLCWIVVLLFGLLIALLSATLLAERLEVHEVVVLHRRLFRRAERVEIAPGTRLRSGVVRARRSVDVLESQDGKAVLLVSRRVYGDRLDGFWAGAGLKPELSEPSPT